MSMLFSTSLVVVVGAGEQPALSPRKLRLWNTKTQTSICELNFLTAVVAVKMNRKRMVVVLERKVHIFELSRNSPLHFLHSLDTARNLQGVAALSTNDDKCHLAVPAEPNAPPGTVTIFDCLNLHKVAEFQPHNSSVQCLAFNHTGDMLVTASDKGTVIRVFSIPSMQRLHTLRRGTVPVTIQSMSFNSNSTMLCVSSDSSTVHVFTLEEAARGREDSITSTDSATATTTSATTLGNFRLPNMFSDMMESSRKFAYVRLKTEASRTLCGIESTGKFVYVVTSDGVFYRYLLSREGGECKLEDEFRLVLDEDPNQTSSRFL